MIKINLELRGSRAAASARVETEMEREQRWEGKIHVLYFFLWFCFNSRRRKIILLSSSDLSARLNCLSPALDECHWRSSYEKIAQSFPRNAFFFFK